MQQNRYYRSQNHVLMLHWSFKFNVDKRKLASSLKHSSVPEIKLYSSLTRETVRYSRFVESGVLKFFAKSINMVTSVQTASIFPPKNLEKYGAQNTHAPYFFKKFLTQCAYKACNISLLKCR